MDNFSPFVSVVRPLQTSTMLPINNLTFTQLMTQLSATLITEKEKHLLNMHALSISTLGLIGTLCVFLFSPRPTKTEK